MRRLNGGIACWLPWPCKLHGCWEYVPLNLGGAGGGQPLDCEGLPEIEYQGEICNARATSISEIYRHTPGSLQHLTLTNVMPADPSTGSVPLHDSCALFESVIWF